jgi:hypothetical protein
MPSSISCEHPGDCALWLVVLTVAGEQQKFQDHRGPNREANPITVEHSIAMSPWKDAKCGRDTQSLKNANLYISEQTCVSRKSKIDLQPKERFAGSPSPGLFSMAITSAEDIEDTLTNLLAD